MIKVPALNIRCNFEMENFATVRVRTNTRVSQMRNFRCTNRTGYKMEK